MFLDGIYVFNKQAELPEKATTDSIEVD